MNILIPPQENMQVTLLETLSAEGMGTMSKNNLIGITFGMRPVKY